MHCTSVQAPFNIERKLCLYQHPAACPQHGWPDPAPPLLLSRIGVCYCNMAPQHMGCSRYGPLACPAAPTPLSCSSHWQKHQEPQSHDSSNCWHADLCSCPVVFTLARAESTTMQEAVRNQIYTGQGTDCADQAQGSVTSCCWPLHSTSHFFPSIFYSSSSPIGLDYFLSPSKISHLFKKKEKGFYMVPTALAASHNEFCTCHLFSLQSFLRKVSSCWLILVDFSLGTMVSSYCLDGLRKQLIQCVVITTDTVFSLITSLGFLHLSLFLWSLVGLCVKYT